VGAKGPPPLPPPPPLRLVDGTAALGVRDVVSWAGECWLCGRILVRGVVIVELDCCRDCVRRNDW